jgi:AcrR family transcriptional regulator
MEYSLYFEVRQRRIAREGPPSFVTNFAERTLARPLRRYPLAGYEAARASALGSSGEPGQGLGAQAAVVGGSKSKSRQASKQETREALVRAGMGLFSEEGVDLPSLDAICARAGFTRGAFYVHFRNRDDFLSAVIDRVLIDFVDAILAAGQSGNDLSDTIARFLTAASQGKVPLMSQRLRILHLMMRGAQRAEKLRARFKLLLEHALLRLAAVTRDGQVAGTVKTPVEPDLVAVWLLSSALGLTTLLNFGLEMDLTRIEQSARELLRIEPR